MQTILKTIFHFLVTFGCTTLKIYQKSLSRTLYFQPRPSPETQISICLSAIVTQTLIGYFKQHDEQSHFSTQSHYVPQGSILDPF